MKEMHEFPELVELPLEDVLDCIFCAKGDQSSGNRLS